MFASSGTTTVSYNMSSYNGCPVRLSETLFDFYYSAFRFQSFQVFWVFQMKTSFHRGKALFQYYYWKKTFKWHLVLYWNTCNKDLTSCEESTYVKVVVKNYFQAI